MRIRTVYILAILGTAILFQACSLKSRIKKADARYEIGEYSAAGELYRRAYNKIPYKDKPLRARIAFQQGECYRLISNNTRAELAYQSAVRYKYPDTTLYLHYAQVLERIGKYEDAKKNYSICLKKDTSNLLAKNGILSCNQVAKWRNDPTRYVVKRMDLFNLRSTDNFSPTIVGDDGMSVIFTSSRQINPKVPAKNSTITGWPTNNMFMAKRNAAGKWEKPFLMGEEINTIDDDEGACTVSADGKVMYFTRSRQVVDSELGTEIYAVNRAGGTWSTPQKIKIFKDTTVSVAHPAISPDGQTLYFVSDARGGLGGKDIWKGTIENGECKFVENLGPQINTPGDEMFPTVRDDGTLYFSSNGLPGFGGLDIFKATAIKSGGWVVQNMGAPINSSSDDFGMAFFPKSESGFFSTNRGEMKGYDAIWSFDLPELVYMLEGKVTDEKGNAIPEASIRVVSSTGINARVQSKKDGTYRVKIDKDMDCQLLATARGYLNQQGKISTQGLKASQTFTQNFKLPSIPKTIEIENIFYEFNKWTLTPESEAGLQTLVKLLKDNPNITIEISANTDYIGNNEANKILSEKRAKSVVDYLIAAGIATDRLTSVGNGEEKPVVADAALVEKYSYMTEGDVLDEAYVLKLSPEQQAEVNQINRRTEFRVLKTSYKVKK